MSGPERSINVFPLGNDPHERRGSYKPGELEDIFNLVVVVTGLPRRADVGAASSPENQLDNFPESGNGYPAEPDTQPPTDNAQTPGAGLGYF